MTDRPKATIPDDISIQDITCAVLDSHTGRGPSMTNPIFEALANVDGKWLHVSYTVQVKEIEAPTEEQLSLMQTDGPRH